MISSGVTVIMKLNHQWRCWIALQHQNLKTHFVRLGLSHTRSLTYTFLYYFTCSILATFKLNYEPGLMSCKQTTYPIGLALLFYYNPTQILPNILSVFSHQTSEVELVLRNWRNSINNSIYITRWNSQRFSL